MSQQPNIIIVGASARAAAFSALRAGMRPYAIDLFADCDLADVCPAIKIKRYPQDFEQALAEAPEVPWIYTGGLENYPDLVGRMSVLRPLYGNGSEVLRSIRKPELLAECLDGSEFSVPIILTAPPPAGSEQEWLLKPRRSSGGLGIRRVSENPKPLVQGESYYQEYVPGPASSAVFLASTEGIQLLGISEQHSGVADIPEEPFLYGGSQVWGCDPDYQAELVDLGRRLAWQFGLRGIFNVDFACFYAVLEVNPRYSASIEVLEYCQGENFLTKHIAQFDAALPGENNFRIPRRPEYVAKRIVYATADCIVTPELGYLRDTWNLQRLLPCIADIPRTGDRILRGQPIVTVIAEGSSNEEVQRLLNERVTAVRRTLMPVEGRNLAQRHQGTEEIFE